MTPETRRLTTQVDVFSSVLSHVTQPIPAADELLVVPVHYWYAASFTRKRGLRLWKAPWGRLSGLIWGGAGARLVANLLLGFVPGVGVFSNAITAVVMTEALGRYLDRKLDAAEAKVQRRAS
ncbi:hypothetical protein [Polyangium sp. 15x6]|uniref:hypothetical protein n=1 Tax=Polyangium sp. 15x6 TaxID=3042687 RepID=UPI00249C2F95|nr:hypothetical protein [Polyangium sp. 15x6]MDI3285603.1 hypothetical protein [Polyangium sp. 15x6]